MPRGVYGEITKKFTQETKTIQQLVDEKKILVVKVDQQNLKRIQQTASKHLGKGELEVLSFVDHIKEQEPQKVLAAVDDKPARDLARILDIEIVGTLGLLLLAKREKIITTKEGQEYLDKLRVVGGYFDSILMEQIRKKLEK